ncbi:MAG: hypothetical protein V7647_938 [Acidobacteriota bacterium]|jgi:uncharacterized protein (TIGR01244 family)
MHRLMGVVVVCGSLASFGAAERAPQAPAASSGPELPPIRNFLRVTPEFCTGGQPRPEHFAQLKAAGITSVLNLRPPSEHQAAEEQAAVQKAGLKYFNIPVVYTAPADAQADEFLRLTDDPANRPMFIHCAAAVRAGAFWMIRRVLRDGMPVDAALAEARRVGLVDAPHLEAFARKYVESHPPKPRSGGAQPRGSL